MVVAVVAVGMMEMVADEVVDMVAVRDLRVPAIGAVDVSVVVPTAVVRRGARVGIGVGHLEDVLVDVVAVGMVEVPVVQIVDVIAVLDGDVAAPGAVLVRVIFVDVVSRVRHDPTVRIAPGRAPQLRTRHTLTSGCP